MKKKDPNFGIKMAAVATSIVIVVTFFLYAVNPPKMTFNSVVTNRTFFRASDIFYEYEVSRYPSSAEVVDLKQEKTIIGFDVDPAKLNFGIIPGNGSYAKKTINFTNVIGKDVRVFVDVSGSIKPFVSVGKESFMLYPNQTAELETFFYTQNDNNTAAIGNYTGSINIVIQIPKYDFVYSLWGSK